ncbi:hypothetical protein HDU86_001021 [Geranomyces michiganensis]|nr:hypothetical protein HDU86_001021 [Geranomyces michiganensis]
MITINLSGLLLIALNKVILLGTLGRDPEKRVFENGGHVWSFPLVTDKPYKKKDGEWASDAQWHNVKYSGEFLSEHAKKGAQVLLEGELKYWKSEDSGKTGVNIVVPKFNRITVTRGSKGRGDSESSEGGSAQQHGGGGGGDWPAQQQ